MKGRLSIAPTELGAYVLAHLLGIVSSYLVNPTLFRMLISAGYQTSISVVGFLNSILTMIAVLILFLIFRGMFSGEPA